MKVIKALWIAAFVNVGCAAIMAYAMYEPAGVAVAPRAFHSLDEGDGDPEVMISVLSRTLAAVTVVSLVSVAFCTALTRRSVSKVVYLAGLWISALLLSLLNSSLPDYQSGLIVWGIMLAAVTQSLVCTIFVIADIARRSRPAK